MAIDVAPWLLRDYDPVGTYLKAFQTGASISAEQTRLAEQQRQANMDYMAKQEAMQQNILKAQVELQMEKAYREQRMSLENAQLEETKRRNTMVAAQAAQDVMERAAYHQAINQRQEQENLAKTTSQESFVDEYKKAIDEGATSAQAYARGLMKAPRLATPTTIPALGAEDTAQQKNMDWVKKKEIDEALRDKREAKKTLLNPDASKEQKAAATADLQDAVTRYTSGAQSITNVPAIKQTTVDKFSSEDEARSAGHKSGDVVYIVGVGKVRLR